MPSDRDPGALFDIRRLPIAPRHENEAAIRGLCRNAYLGNDMAVCRILGRYKIFVDTRDVGITPHLLLDGFWEMWVTEAIVRHVRPGMSAIDVGANLGYFTLLLADLAGPRGKVLAFEPNPALAGRLRRSVEVNGFAPSTTVHELALGAEAGLAMLDVSHEQPGGGRAVACAGDAGGSAIPVQRLDAIEGALDADFIKIDVEGDERNVWAGMAGLLERRRPLTIFMEFTVCRYGDPHAFLDEILSAGFSLGIVDPDRGVRPITREEIFAQSPIIDHMLVFRRS